MHKSLEKFEPYIEKKLIRKVVSPCKKLVLYNYTDACVYERAWDEVTLNARGTVYEIATGNVVAKAMPKAFNFGEHSPEKQAEMLKAINLYIFTKEDGSCTITYYYDNEWKVNTRGSFTSDQAVKAKEILYRNNLGNLNPSLTYIAEVIYPENRIIVDYGNKEDLVMLTAFFTETEKELCRSEFIRESRRIGFTYAKAHKFSSLNAVIDNVANMSYNEEGFIVQFENGEKVKVKSAEYLRLARIISNMSPLAFWEKMVDGKVDREFLEQLPEEFREESEKIMDELEKKYSDMILKIAEDYCDVMVALDVTRETEDVRKKVGVYLKQNKVEHSSAIFPTLLGREDAIDRYILKQIRPNANQM